MNSIVECIARYGNIDTRRAMGFLPRKLPPSNLVIKAIKTWRYPGYPFGEVSFMYGHVVLKGFENGEIEWAFWKDGVYRYKHDRPG